MEPSVVNHDFRDGSWTQRTLLNQASASTKSISRIFVTEGHKSSERAKRIRDRQKLARQQKRAVRKNHGKSVGNVRNPDMDSADRIEGALYDTKLQITKRVESLKELIRTLVQKQQKSMDRRAELLERSAATQTSAEYSSGDMIIPSIMETSHDILHVLSKFLKAAAAKRFRDDDHSLEMKAFEGVHLSIYQGNASAVEALGCLVEGSRKHVSMVDGLCSCFTCMSF
ncbi:MAG: hypothetical protein Q9164_005957 [Protoblastenia rupestris]